MEIIYFNTKAKLFLEALSTELVIGPRISGALELLEKYGNRLGMPFSKALGGGVFELRVVGVIHIRILYVFHDGYAWVIHAFNKKTNRIQGREMSYARKQQRALLRKHNT